MMALKMATWNIDGLAPKKHELETLLNMYQLDICLISETHFTARSQVNIRDYYIYNTTHPDGTGHGGTAIIIKSRIKHHMLPSFQTAHIQATSIAIEDRTGNFNISAVYCPPRHKITEGQLTEYFKTLGDRFIAGGDWNAKHVHWGSRLISTRGRQLKTCLEKNHLTTFSTSEPTHWPSDPNKQPDLLDFYITKGLSRLFFLIEPCLDSSSNHTPVMLTVSATILKHESCKPLYNSKTDWDSFRDLVDEMLDLKVALKTCEDIDSAVKTLTNTIQVACWESTSEDVHLSARHKIVPWEIRQKILEKRRLRRVWHTSRLQEDKAALNSAARALKIMIEDVNNATLQGHLISLTATGSTNYSLWKTVKNHDRPQNPKPPIKLENRKWARTDQQRVDAFAQHLEKVFTPNEEDAESDNSDVDGILQQNIQSGTPLKPTSPAELIRLISKFDTGRAPGFDLITKKVLEELPRKGLVFLTSLFNRIMSVGYYPALWKVSQIIMIYKTGKPIHDITSYRPISLLPIISKLFERVLLNRMLVALKESHVIPDHQFGFRQQHGTVEQVHRVYSVIRKSLEEKEYCASAFLDVQQAFDRVWHKGLLCKIKMLLPHTYYSILKSYLEERLFQVKDDEYTSKFHKIEAGVPQGSVLGPVLYTIFTSDLPQAPGITVATFADDTAVLASDKDPKEASRTLQLGLDNIDKWLRKWRIRASASKSVQVTFTLRREDCPPVKLGEKTLPHTNSVRYLGMHLDRRLTWKKHIQAKRDELNLRYRGLYWLLGRNSKLSIDNKLLIYKVILKPIWTYGLQLWGSACNTSINIIQRFQNSLLRQMANAPWFMTNMEIHTELGMETVKEEIKKYASNYRKRLEGHPNQLARSLPSEECRKRLKKRNIMELSE